MSEWSSSQYLKFKNQRTLPALDLASRIKEYDVKIAADIGCGPGNSTSVVKNTFPNARVIGVDSSDDMIKKARASYPELEFVLSDALALDGKYDLLFSNACLQWIPDHRTLIPALMDKLNAGGVLAVQIPMNGDEPLYKIISEVASEKKWGFDTAQLERNDTLTPIEYYDILSSCSADFQIWETKYYHSMPDCTAMLEWVRGSRLRPYLAQLGEEAGIEFEAEILKLAEKTYRKSPDGGVVFGFKRFFFTSVKSND